MNDMQSHRITRRYRPATWAALALTGYVLTACGMPGYQTAVSIHAVNYTDKEFIYSIEDPTDKKNEGGGELVDSYSAGGTLCCYKLPNRWKPGIQVRVNTKQVFHNERNERIKEENLVHIADVPPYSEGKPGELWVIRNADNTMSVISSDYQPDHPKWPGKVKGWPVPSLEYRRTLWSQQVNLAELAVRDAEQSVRSVLTSPTAHAADVWALLQQYRPSDIEKFSGPEDQKFLEKVAFDAKQSLIDSKARLERLKASKP